MKVFITGGTGFIGKRVLTRLVEQRHEVRALARSDRSAALVKSLGASVVRGDVNDVASMREGMRGSDVVFHIAAWYELGVQNVEKMERINVEGTRNVLELAYQLEIPKIVYTSTVGVYGDTGGRVVDESYVKPGPPFLTTYDRTKWEAHYKVALPLIERGAPIIIVQPGAVYGPGDHSLVGDLMERFYEGRLPVLPGPETMLTYAHVDDVAEGHILAAEKGKVGESYNLAGPALTMAELVALWEEITGKRGPLFHVPASLIRPFASLVGVLEDVVSLPKLFSKEAIKILGASYAARSDKAKEELGWTLRPLREGMLESFIALAQEKSEEEPSRVLSGRQRQITAVAVVLGFTALLLWFLNERNRE